MASRGGAWGAGVHHSRVHHPKRPRVPGQLHIEGVCGARGREGRLGTQVLHLWPSRQVSNERGEEQQHPGGGWLARPHLHGSEDGLSIHLVVAAPALVEEDLLWVGLSAQQLQLARRHFGQADKPLNLRLLLLPRLCKAAREPQSARQSEDGAARKVRLPSPKSRTTLATYGLSSSSLSMRMCWPVEMTVVPGRPSTLMAIDLQHRRVRVDRTWTGPRAQ